METYAYLNASSHVRQRLRLFLNNDFLSDSVVNQLHSITHPEVTTIVLPSYISHDANDSFGFTQIIPPSSFNSLPKPTCGQSILLAFALVLCLIGLLYILIYFVR